MLFSNKGETVSMVHFKEIETGLINIKCSRIGSKKVSDNVFPYITSYNLEIVLLVVG